MKPNIQTVKRSIYIITCVYCDNKIIRFVNFITWFSHPHLSHESMTSCKTNFYNIQLNSLSKIYL